MSPESREDARASLLESLDHLEHYNRERLPASSTSAWTTNSRVTQRLDRTFFLRATMLAGDYQTRFTRSAQAITLLAIIAAAFLGVHLSLSSIPSATRARSRALWR